MLLIKKGQTNDISVSVSLNATLSSPTYLFRFVNILSKDTYIFYPKVLLLNERYDEFQFIEGNPTNLFADPPVVSFTYEGQYWVYIYQMPCGSTSLDPADGELLFDGRAQVIDDCPDPQYWQFISSNEDNANFIFIQEDEQCPPTPSPTATQTSTPTPTPSFTPTQTGTPTQTPTPTTTLTATPTNTPTQTQTITPTQTQTETPTNTPTQTQTGTPTNTPTNTQTPTNTNTPTTTTTPTPTPTASSIPFDADAALYLEAVLLTGGTLNATISGATDTLFKDLKTYGIYNKILAMWPFLGAIANSTRYNAVNLSEYTMGWNGAPSFSVSGVSGNGINAYGNSNLSNQILSGNSFHVLCAQNAASGGGGDHNYGTTGVDPRIQLQDNNAGNFTWRGGPNISQAVSNSGNTTGITIQTRDGSNTTNLYYETSLIDSIIGSYTSGADRNLYFMALNVSNAPLGGSYSSGRFSFFGIGLGLTPSEVVDYVNIVNTFNTTLGR
jgi:hypothetical protein